MHYRIAQAVDPAQPFVYNEGLSIKVSGPNVTPRTFVYGAASKDYRIDNTAELYVGNYQTAKDPMQYKVEVWRKDIMIGSFNFATTK